MNKTLKKTIASVMAAAIMAVSFVGVSANASGNISRSISGTTAAYSFDVDGNKVSATRNDAHYGRSSDLCITILYSGSYNVTFNGASNSPATVYFYKINSNNTVSTNYTTSFHIPQSVSGMPTLYTSINLPTGKYMLKFVSDSNTTYSSSYFAIHGVAGTSIEKH